MSQSVPSISPSRHGRRRSTHGDNRRRHTSMDLLQIQERESQSGNWNDWAMFIVSETKRFAVDIQKNETQMMTLRDSISDLKITLKGLELIVSRITMLEEDGNVFQERLSNLEQFKTKAIAVSSTVWAVLGLGITIMAVFLSRTPDETTSARLMQ